MTEIREEHHELVNSDGARIAGDVETAPVPVTAVVPRVILVDDDPAIRSAIARYLQRSGFAIEAFENVADVLRSLAQRPVDLVITDLLMPDTDGMELLMALRKRDPRPKVIVISGGGAYMGSSMKAARQLGAAATLWKPFLPSDLLKLMQSVLAAPAGQTG